MDNTTEVQAPVAPALSVDDQVKLANILRDDRKVEHAIKVDQHNLMGNRLGWIQRVLMEPALSGRLTNEQLDGLADRMGKMLVKFTRMTEDDDFIWPIR